MELTVRNVNDAFSEIFWKFKVLDLKPEQTRNGPALVYPEPVITTYLNPAERVLFHAGRDANPIFHLMESIWMLAGRNDVEFLQHFNSKIGQYSDNGRSFNAAYGYRWRHHFGRDQLVDVIEMLRRDPTTRQAVIQMWDSDDLTKQTKDKACNTQLVFDTRGGVLNMAVFNRSNDLWWGAYGANAVHFSVLQEVVASAIQMPLGVYRQISNNLHLYTELYNAEKYLAMPPVAEEYNLYASDKVKSIPIMLSGDYKSFLAECDKFCSNPFADANYTNPFFRKVAHPMAMVSRVRKNKEGIGRTFAENIRASDWREAVHAWINRREAAKQK